MVNKHAHLFAAFSMLSILSLLLVLNIDKTQFYPHKVALPIVNNDNSFTVKSTRELIQLFDRFNYTTPIKNNSDVPELFLSSIPADFKTIKNIKQKKSIFFRFMVPLIIKEQTSLQQKRIIAKILLKNSQKLSQPDVIYWFNQAVKEYKIKSSLSFKQKKDELLKRLDGLPLTLILAQAAIESAWGTSRFAIEGNSLFGEWIFNSKNGLTPKNRIKGKSHQIKAFSTLRASIRSYLKNINSNKAYKELRSNREKMRIENEKLDAHKLANDLHRYSQKGKEYVKIIRRLLNTADFNSLVKLSVSL